MGYESRIYIVDRYGDIYDPETDKYWANVVCEFRLGKVSREMERWLRRQIPTKLFIYADDGNTKLIEDCCREPLKELDMDELKYILREEIHRNGINCIQNITLSALANGVLPRFERKYGDLVGRYVALHYGY